MLAGLAPVEAASISKNLAPGFDHLLASDTVLILPPDVELFSLSAGGVPEPKADWTAGALAHMKSAVAVKATRLGLATNAMNDADADDFAEQISLHAAVARSIALHHAIGGAWALPTKDGRLDWTFEDAMKPLATKTGATYGLFIWVRDSYASTERKAAMFAMALFGVGLQGGTQTGYASLVNLDTGRVVWFNNLRRNGGDLRDPASAAESIDALLAEFPTVR